MAKPRAKAKASRLTEKQEAFAVAVAKGASNAAAYRAAYDAKNMSDETIYVEACRLLGDPKVALRVQKLMAPVLKRHEASVERLMEEAVATALGEAGEPLTYGAKIKALDMLFKHHGLYERDNAQRQPNLALQINFVGQPTAPKPEAERITD